jgi:hypothetical protein
VIFYEQRSRESLKRAIIESKNKNLDELSRNIFEKALKYNWEDIATKTKGLYKKITNPVYSLITWS